MKPDNERTSLGRFLAASKRATRLSIVNIRGKCIALLILPLTMSLGCSDQHKRGQLVSRPVKVVRIGDRADARAMSFAGEVKARYGTTLSFRVAGKLLERQVDVGDRVHQGQMLAKLDDNDFRLSVRNLQSQLAAAVAERDFLQDDLARYRDLLAQQVISPPEFERHDIAFTTAQKRAGALEAQLDLAANQLVYTELRADRDGVVTALEVETGQMIGVGQAVVKLARLDEKEVQFDVPEHRLPAIARGQEVGVTLWAEDNRRLKARIREVAAAADPASRTYRIKAALVEGLDTAQLGMTATVWLPSNRSSRIAIPLSTVFAPQNQPGQSAVWLVNEQAGTVRSVPVRLGETVEGERIAVDGLAAGQLLVSAGVQRLTEGQAVRLPPENASAMSGESAENGERRL